MCRLPKSACSYFTILLISLARFDASTAQVIRTPRYVAFEGAIRYRPALHCYPYYLDSSIGMSYAFNTRLPGIKLHTYKPWLLGVPLHLLADLDWKPEINDNSYFNIEVTRLNFAGPGKIEHAVTAGYKNIRANDVKLMQFFIASAISIKEYRMGLGYARQNLETTDIPPSKITHGIRTDFKRELFYELTIEAIVIYWFNKWQYALKIHKPIPRTSIILGAGWEKIHWHQIDLSIVIDMDAI